LFSFSLFDSLSLIVAPCRVNSQIVLSLIVVAHCLPVG
jgi:hypothetical protein